MKHLEHVAYWERTPAYILSVFLLKKTWIISNSMNSNSDVIITNLDDFYKTFMI